MYLLLYLSCYFHVILCNFIIFFFFFFNDTATTEIYTLSLHDALPAWPVTAPCTSSRTCAAPVSWTRPAWARWWAAARSFAPAGDRSPWWPAPARSCRPSGSPGSVTASSCDLACRRRSPPTATGRRPWQAKASPPSNGAAHTDCRDELPRVFRTGESCDYLRGCLHFQQLVHDFLRSPVTECRVKTSPIIAELDVARNVFRSLPACRIDGTVDQLDLDGAVHRFRQRVIVADSGAPDRLPDIQAIEHPGVLGRGIIASAVGVKPNSV